jgi:hypothetical protein
MPVGLGNLLPPSPPAEKATACKDQAGQTCACDGAGDSAYALIDTGKILIKRGISTY